MPDRFFGLSSDLMAVSSADEPAWRRLNPAFERILGWHETEIGGARVQRLVQAEDEPRLDDLLRKVERGESSGPHELRMLTGGGGYEPIAWRIVREGEDLLWIGQQIAARAEENLRAQVRQLGQQSEHRIRNNLAVIRAIIRRMSSSPSYEEPLGYVQGRIDAFARVQAKLRLPAEQSAGVDLTLLIEDELLANSVREGEQLTVEGPTICLLPRAAEVLSLAIHELVINAIKFGALGIVGGHVTVRWHLDRDGTEPRLVFLWSEHGVMPAGPLARDGGFGMETLLQALPYELGASTSVELGEDGLVFTLSAPIEHLTAKVM